MSHIDWVARQNKLEIPRDKDEVNKRGKLVQTLLYYESRLHESRKRQKICTEARRKLLFIININRENES
jgi:hypothetical protein